MRYGLVIAIVLSAAPAFAQVQSRPTDAPLVSAQNESWYQLREPIDVAGDLYFPSGAAVFFNGNTMVRSGHYNGVPVYADTTLEPFSVIFVPVGRGQMQPYERPRRGDLAGTSGSRTPSFPVALVPQGRSAVVAAVAPTALPVSIGAVNAYSPSAPVAVDRPVVQPTAAAARVALTPVEVQTIRRPENNDGVWVAFAGDRWISAGPAVPVEGSGFVRAGDYAGFTVYRRQGASDSVIYLPTRDGLVAPYRRKTP